MVNMTNALTCNNFRLTSRCCFKYFLVTILITVGIFVYLEGAQNVSLLNYIATAINFRSTVSNRTNAGSRGDVQFLLQKGNVITRGWNNNIIRRTKKPNQPNRYFPIPNVKNMINGALNNTSVNLGHQMPIGQTTTKVYVTERIRRDSYNSLDGMPVKFRDCPNRTANDISGKGNFSAQTFSSNTTISAKGIGVSTGTREIKPPKVPQFNYFGTHELLKNFTKDMFEPFCAAESNRQKYLIWPDTPSDFTDWSFTKRRKCPKLVINTKIINMPRIKYSLYCDARKAQLLPSKVTSSSDVDVTTLNNTCLNKFVSACCSNDNGVPNVVHYVWYFRKAMKFETFLSILSVVRYVRPCLILFHGEYLPYGLYWDYIIRLFPNIIHVNTPWPLTITGKKIRHHEHSGDVMRIHALILHGGIYLDTDVIVLRDLKPLRHYDISMCRQTGGQFLLNSFIISKKNATFLSLWLEGYDKDYRNYSYVYNSMYYNNDLSRKYPDLIHVENGTMCCPDELIGVNLQSPMIYEWTKLYGFHIYSRQINFPWNVDLIRNFSTTLGSMLRHVVHGNKELCF